MATPKITRLLQPQLTYPFKDYIPVELNDHGRIILRPHRIDYVLLRSKMLKLDIKRNAIRGTGIPNGSKLKELAHMLNLTSRLHSNQLELWRPVIGYESLYEVSNLGKVKRLKQQNSSRNTRLLGPTSDGRGYLLVTLYKDNTRTTIRVHRLVALAFLGKPSPPRDHVNHINSNRSDNRLENLEWVTRSENTKHSFAKGLSCVKGELAPNAKLNWSQVHSIKNLLNEGLKGTEIAKQFNASTSTISDIKNGKIWKE